MAPWRVSIALLTAAVFGLVAWLFVKHGLNASKILEVSQALRIPRAPLYFFMALSTGLSALAAVAIALTGPMVDPEDTHKEEAL
jgi:hypothetical protein